MKTVEGDTITATDMDMDMDMVTGIITVDRQVVPSQQNRHLLEEVEEGAEVGTITDGARI